jgi:hypothetical protein
MPAALITCNHCNGTTFCSARKDADGKLKTRPACYTCLARSGLDPNGIYDKVVCSVCGGRGVVRPEAQPAPRPQRARNPWLPYVILAPLVIVSLGVATLSAIAIYRQQHTYDDPAALLVEDVPGSTSSNLTKAELFRLVSVGMSKGRVKDAIGDPDSIKESPEGIDVWMYRCKDGRVLITFTNEVVYSRYAGH